MTPRTQASTDEARGRGTRVGELWSRANRPAIVTAWLFVLVGTNVPRIVANEALGVDPAWLGPVQLAAVAALLALTVLDERLRALQSFALALLALRLSTFGPLTDVLAGLVRGTPQLWRFLVSFLFVAAIALVVLACLLARGDDRESLSLQRGTLSATAAREWLPGFRRERPWLRHGSLVGTAVVGTLTLALIAGGATFAVRTESVAGAMTVGVVIVVGASANAFAEEFLFRAAPLADLSELLSKRHAMVLLGALFGLSHYYGAPGGVPGVLMAFFLGWWLTKSVLETRGLLVAWTVHALLDVLLLLALLGP